MMFVMWELKVESDCSMLCSSPMSAWTESKTGRRLPSSAGMGRPAWAMSAEQPDGLEGDGLAAGVGAGDEQDE